MISNTPTMRNFARVTNAIDVAAQPEAWHDFLRLVSGRKAEAVIADRKARAEASGDTYSEVPTSPPKVVLRWLADYAKAVGSPALEAAFTSARHYYRQLSQFDVVASAAERRSILTQSARPPDVGELPERLAPAKGAPADRLRDRLDPAAAADVADVPIATTRIKLALGDPETPVHTALSDLSALSRAKLTQMDATSVVEALLPVDRPPREKMAIHVQLFTIAARAGLWRQAHDILMGLLQQEEPAYLERYPDVAAVVGKGRIASGLMHFLRHGETEGRQGFDSALEAVNRLTRKGDPPRTLAQTLRWLGSAAS